MTQRRWGNAMTQEALDACRADIVTADRGQLAQDVTDLLEEVDSLRFNITCRQTEYETRDRPSNDETAMEDFLSLMSRDDYVRPRMWARRAGWLYEGESRNVKLPPSCNVCDLYGEHAPDCPVGMCCEFVVPGVAGNVTFCNEKGHAFVGTDHTPYCSKHWREMQRREELST